MNNRRFLKRLRSELPLWVEHGWVKAGCEEALLEHVAARSGAGITLVRALLVFGVLLLGSGVITFFAANWAEMSKLVKLIILFATLWTTYGVAGYLLQDERHTVMGQAMLLLGVILFGANIMLIAQIYHIDAHYPNGVLLWSLGALLTAYLLPSQAAMVVAIVLSILWTGMEMFDFEHFNWGFLLLWSLFLPRIYVKQWMPALHLAMFALLTWTLFTFFANERWWTENAWLYLTQLYALLYLALFLIGMLMATNRSLMPYAGVVQHYSAIAVVCGFYILTSPELQTGISWVGDETLRGGAEAGWTVATLLATALVAILSIWHRKRTLSGERPAYLIWGQGLIVAGIMLVLVNLVIPGGSGSLVAIAFNLLFLAGLIWLIVAGMHTHNRSLINLAFTFFALLLLARYFDTFWSLMNRSLFFMAGGVVLIIGGHFLEKKRQRVMQKMKHLEEESGS